MKNRIIAFLKKSGFKRVEASSYANELCNVVISDSEVIIANNEGDQNFLRLDFYTVFGFLSFHRLINR